MPIFDIPLPELEMYVGRNPRPADFDAYWARALEEVGATEANPELFPVTTPASFAECFDLWYTGVRGARIHARYAKPVGNGPHPIVLLFHGYGGDSGPWMEKYPWVAQGFAVASMDVRGQGGLSEDVGGVRGTTWKGQIVRGLEDHPDNLLFRQIFLDTSQLVRVVSRFPEIDATRIAALGGSQGGGLTLACAALEPTIGCAVAIFPFLSDYLRVWEMDLDVDAYQELRDFFRFRDPTHARADETFERLGYIDVQHLAGRIRGRVLMATGLMDTICPPSSQFAAYNKIHENKEIVVYPDFGHENLPGFSDISFEFISANL